jgi:hypothetical protein
LSNTLNPAIATVSKLSHRDLSKKHVISTGGALFYRAAVERPLYFVFILPNVRSCHPHGTSSFG